MVRQAEFECPCCGGSVRAWYQSNAATVTCPICRRDVSAERLERSQDKSARRHGLVELLRALLSGMSSSRCLGRIPHMMRMT
jgi:endogenous inhibitor of DNA gyrase (YacG/DUF329 family)